MADVKQYGSMNQQSGAVSLDEIQRQERAYAAQSVACFREQNGRGWGGSMADLHHAAHEAASAGSMDGIAPSNAPISPPEQVARTTAGHAAYQAAISSARLGQTTGVGLIQGVSQQTLAMGKIFSRGEAVTIIRAERTRWFDDGTEAGGIRYRAAMQALDEMQRVFERME